MPSAAARIAAQLREREPPPVTMARSIRVPAAAQRVQPVTEREGDALEHGLRQAGDRSPCSSPRNAPRTCTSLCGVRSPERYGRNSGRGRLTGAVPSSSISSAAGAPATEAHHSRLPAADRMHRHLVPGVRQRVTEGVHRLRRVGAEPVGRRPQHARRAEREKGVAGRDGAEADRGRGVVARAAGDDRRDGHAPARRQFGAQPPGRRVALDQARHLRRVRARWRQAPRPTNPAPPRRAKASRRRPTCPRPARPTAAAADRLSATGRSAVAAAHARLMLAHPGEFRRREAGHGDVAGDRAQRRQRRLKLHALRRGATVVPQHAGPEHAVPGVEQHRTMHLPGQADRGRSRERGRSLPAERVDGLQCGRATNRPDPVRTSRDAAATP